MQKDIQEPYIAWITLLMTLWYRFFNRNGLHPNDSARRRRASKKLFEVTLEITIQQESQPEIVSIKDENEIVEESLIDTNSILQATLKILKDIENENDADLVKIESSGQVLISSEPIEEISSPLDPKLVYQEIETDDGATTGAAENVTDDKDVGNGEDSDGNDKSASLDQNSILKLQTENENLKLKLTLVEDNFDEMKSNYDSIKWVLYGVPH